jgi:hypothetical protein
MGIRIMNSYIERLLLMNTSQKSTSVFRTIDRHRWTIRGNLSGVRRNAMKARLIVAVDRLFYFIPAIYPLGPNDYNETSE